MPEEKLGVVPNGDVAALSRPIEEEDLTTSPIGEKSQSPRLDQSSTESPISKSGSQNGDDLEIGIQELKDELNKLKVEPPTINLDLSEFENQSFPETYVTNSHKEKLVLAFAENFRRQYVHLYRDRKPLFLNPVNEAGVEKFVCTSIRPTQLPFTELYDWDGAAEFVSDYLNFETLDPAHELPPRLLSLTSVFKRQKGNAFEYSTILCSLLIGAGYDAYVISGYATKETCLMDATRKICPLLLKSKEKKEDTVKKITKKYTVKPPKDLRSKFIMKQEEQKRKEIKEAEEKSKREEEERQAELEKPPIDPLHGLRVHSWVLVLDGKREVPESFFIEPFSGNAHPLDSEEYLGIESLWNHQNYWVNMQDCSEGCKNMKYDLGDSSIWEYMFPSNEKPHLQIPEEEFIEGLDDEEDEDAIEKHLDVPASWVEQLQISKQDFEMRCPYGKKIKYYKRATLEKFAHYLLRDGLTSRFSIYNDIELIQLKFVKEIYAHRADKLFERDRDQITGQIKEHFYPGRKKALKEHQFQASCPGPENERTMIFYDSARVDGLTKREETPLEMTEHFNNRDDFLYFRQVEFGKRAKKFGPSESSNLRPIVKMVEKYKRNRLKSAQDDIFQISFYVAEEKIQLTYHTEDSKISASTREFIKPPNADEKGAILVMTPDMHSTFQVDPNVKDKKMVQLYQTLVELIKREEKCTENIRFSEDEVQNILNERMKEESACELDISVYDTERNEKAKSHRKHLEALLEEEKRRKDEMELDYLAPFLAQIGDPERITRPQAEKLKNDCQSDLKQRLVDKANLIQARFEKETQELQKKQTWYQQNQVSMQKEDEDEYLNYCSEAMFRIHILELRLNRHKEMAPFKYMALDKKIRTDPRLRDFFENK